MKKLLLSSILTCTMLLSLFGFSIRGNAVSNVDTPPQEITPYFDTIVSGLNHQMGVTFNSNPQTITLQFMERRPNLHPLHYISQGHAIIWEVGTSSSMPRIQFFFNSLEHTHRITNDLPQNRTFNIRVTGSVVYGSTSPLMRETFNHQTTFRT